MNDETHLLPNLFYLILHSQSILSLGVFRVPLSTVAPLMTDSPTPPSCCGAQGTVTICMWTAAALRLHSLSPVSGSCSFSDHP
jgi:hypothetical protein